MPHNWVTTVLIARPNMRTPLCLNWPKIEYPDGIWTVLHIPGTSDVRRLSLEALTPWAKMLDWYKGRNK